MGNEDVDWMKYIEYQNHWPIFFIGGIHREEKSLLEPWCDDCDGVGSVTEVTDENADDIEGELLWWIEIRGGGVLIELRLFFSYWTLVGWFMFMNGMTGSGGG